MSIIMPRMRAVLDRYLSGLGEENVLANLDWDSLQWSSFLIELFEGEDPKWRDGFFQLAFLSHDLPQLKKVDLLRLLEEAKNVATRST